MKFFIDTAILKEIEWAEERGIIDGVTTNPTLLSQTDRKLGEVIHDILRVVKDRPVFIEAVSQTADELVAEGKEIAKLAKNVVVTVPMTDEGMMAIQQLGGRGIKTNVSLVFTAVQALLAARAGATYVSIFVGRLDDARKNGMDVIKDTVHIFNAYRAPTEVIAASLRHSEHVEAAALAEAACAAIPFKVLVQMYRHDMTDRGIKKYLEDWEKVPK
ncbi:MAG: fructose-6-phosphate aldolase [Patescibacteria group bacterium]